MSCLSVAVRFLSRYPALMASVFFTITIFAFVPTALTAEDENVSRVKVQAEKPQPRRPGTFADSGGFYAAGSNGNIGTLNAFKASVDADINERLREAKSKGLINVVQLSEGERFRGDLPAAKKKLADWLSRTDLSLIDAVHLCEEHPLSAEANLEALYDQIKAADLTLPVYFWPSYPLGPFCKSDGWMYDAYGPDYTDFRRIAFDFLKTGKPLIICIDGSGYSDIRSAREQVMVCHELDIPIFYFVADGGSGSVSKWRNLPRASLIPWRCFVYSAIEFQKRCGSDGMSAADMVWAEPIEVSADPQGKIEQTWHGLGPATVFGFTRLGLEGEKFWAKNAQRATLDLPFWSVFPVEKAELTLLVDRDPEAMIEVKRSRCGQPDEWQKVVGNYADGKITYPLGESLGHEFRIRIELLGMGSDQKTSPIISSYSLTGMVDVPSDRAVDLDFFYDDWRGEIQLRQDLAAGLWRTIGQIEQSENLEPSGLPALRGRSGSGVSSTIIEKLTSEKPLKNIVVRLTGFEDSRNLGGSFSLGVSLDGKTVLSRVSPEISAEDSKNPFRGTVTLDLSGMPEFDGCQTFFVHLEQKNHSGVRSHVSSSLNQLEVDAKYKIP